MAAPGKATQPVHAHHIVMKDAGHITDPTAQEALKKSRGILEKVGIDPYYGRENLVWGPNGYGHHGEYAKAVYTRLQRAFNRGKTAADQKDRVVKELQKIARDWNNGLWAPR